MRSTGAIRRAVTSVRSASFRSTASFRATGSRSPLRVTHAAFRPGAVRTTASIFGSQAFPDFIDPPVDGVEPGVKAFVVKIEDVTHGQKSKDPVVTFNVDDHELDGVAGRYNDVPQNAHMFPRSKDDISISEELKLMRGSARRRLDCW
jgi:hypothetical protein